MISIETIQTVNHLLAIGGIIALVMIPLLIYDLVYTRLLFRYIHNYGIQFSFVVVTASTVLTLIYSELFGIVPCGLCWFERIMLYPQILILCIALYFRDIFALRHGIALSCIGIVISLYHHWIQMGGTQFVKCPSAGAVDCAKRFLFEFDFITFPLLSAILFGFLILFYLYILRTSR